MPSESKLALGLTATLLATVGLITSVRGPSPGAGPLTEDERRAFLEAHLAGDRALRAEDGEGARQRFERALEIAPAHPTIAYGLACAHSLEGDLDGARAWLEQAIEWGFTDAALARWDTDLKALRAGRDLSTLLAALPAPEAAEQPVLFTGQEEGSWTGSLAASGSVGFAGHDDGTVSVLHLPSGRCLASWSTGETQLWAVAIAPGGHRGATLDHDGGLALWLLDSGKEIARVQAFPPRVPEPVNPHEPWPKEPGPDWNLGAFLEFDPTGRHLMAAGGSRGGSLWTANGAPVRRWDHALGQWTHVPLSWSPDGEELAWGDGTRVVRISASDGSESVLAETDEAVTALEYDPAGGRLVTGHDGGWLRSWDLEDGRQIWSERLEMEDELAPVMWPWRFPQVFSIAHDPRTERIAYTVGKGLHALVRDRESGELLWIGPFDGGRMSERTPVTWDEDGGLWWGFESGVLDVVRAEPVPPGPEARLGRGAVPVWGTDGWGLMSLSGGGVAGVRDGRIHWIRGLPERTAPLFGISGHLDLTDRLDHLDGWVRIGDETFPLADLLIDLHDPKRVRMAAAGVPLHPVEP